MLASYIPASGSEVDSLFSLGRAGDRLLPGSSLCGEGDGAGEVLPCALSVPQISTKLRMGEQERCEALLEEREP
jgi:hypothetical protein